MAKDEDLLKDAKKAFQRASEAESKNRQNWLDDVRFARLGEQWPEAVRKQREAEGRPCLTLNRLPAFIRQVTNDARQNSPSIKFHPVGDGADQATAKVLDGLTRNIEYTSNADVAYDTALENAVTGGFGYFRISTDYAADDAFDQDIRIERIPNPLSVYGDPLSFGADSADWNSAFITEMWDAEAFRKAWPGASESDFDADSRDHPNWYSGDQVRVAEYWTREEVPAKLLRLSNGMVMFEVEYLKIKDLLEVQQISVTGDRPTKTQRVTQRIITGADVLETNKWAGKYIPIVPVYGDEVIVDGERHLLSLVRFAKDPQQMLNFWRTASTELVALAPKTPFIGPVGAFNTDAAKWATANSVSHAYIEYDPVVGGAAPQRQQFAGPPAGALQEAINASDDMKSIMGIFDASLGARSNETSGRAILARQREGDVSTFNYIDNLSRAIRHAGRIIADLIPKVYDTPRIIRVIHEDGTNKNVQINQEHQPDPDEKQDLQEEMQGVTRMFDLTAGKYDVTCEAGPSYTTKREESASQMVEFMRAVPQAGALMGDLVAQNLDWPGADDIAERLKSMLPPPAQGQNPQLMQAQQQIQQMQQQMGQMGQQLQEAQRDKALEARKLDIDAYNAETNRIKASGAGMNPEQVQMLVMQTLQQALQSPDILPGPPPAAPPMFQQPGPPQQPEQQQQPEPPPGGFLTPEGSQ